jgi:hypothetical protein
MRQKFKKVALGKPVVKLDSEKRVWGRQCDTEMTKMRDQ